MFWKIQREAGNTRLRANINTVKGKGPGGSQQNNRDSKDASKNNENF